MLRAASRPAARLVGRRGYAVAGRDGRPTRELSRIFEAASTGDHVDRARRPTGLFGRADLIEPAALTALAERTKADAAALVTGLLRGAVKTPAAVVDAFDELSNTICLTADLAEAVRNTHPDKAYVAAAEDAIRSLGNSINVLNTNVDLYNVRRAKQGAARHRVLLTGCAAVAPGSLRRSWRRWCRRPRLRRRSRRSSGGWLRPFTTTLSGAASTCVSEERPRKGALPVA